VQDVGKIVFADEQPTVATNATSMASLLLLDITGRRPCMALKAHANVPEAKP
jgi:hypothetical protein